MSNTKLFIDGYLNQISNKFNISNDIAFEIFSISTILERSFDDIYNNVQIQGNQDGGIDGIYFEDFENYYIMHIFQCKNKKALKQNELDKLKANSSDIFIKGINLPNISDLKSKIDEYKQLSQDGFLIELRHYFLYNGLNDDPNYKSNKLLYDEYHRPSEFFEIYDNVSLYNKISNSTKSVSKRNKVDFTFKPEKSNVILSSMDNQAIYSYSIQNIRSVNFRISAIEICNLIEYEMSVNTTYDYLYEDNIRGFLGLRTKANQKMQSTLDNQDESLYFPFLNNGITIICSKLILPNNPQTGNYLIPSTNPVIVNGLQTTRVLFNKYKDNMQELENVFVNVRLYETDDKKLIDKITDATNTQTPINFRDKVSNKSFNVHAKELFNLKGISYITKKGDLFLPKNKDNITVNSDTVLKFWYATYFEKPEVSKNSIAKVLEHIYDSTNSELSSLYKLVDGNPHSTFYQQLYRAYLIYKIVLDKKHISKDKYEFISYSDELISYGIYKTLENNLEDTEDHIKLSDSYESVLLTIDKIVKEDITEHEKVEKTFSYSSYFKKPKCRIDYNKTKGLVESDKLITELLSK